MSQFSPPPVGPDWTAWARATSAQLARLWPKIQWRTQRDNASENGVMLWDDSLGYPVVTKAGAFVPVCIEGQLLLRSPDDTLWRVTVDNAGVVSAVAV